MRFRFIPILLFAPLLAFGREPSSPLFNLQFWAKNKGGEIKTDNPLGSGRIFEVQTCSGVDLNLTKAWDISTGSKDVVVAILDDGFELNHENYRSNLGKGFNAINPNLLPDSCLKDIDRNGKVTEGCGYWHGNMALGIIGAAPSKKFGIAGINWQVSLMPLKKGDQQGVGADRSNEASLVALAITYAVNHGARIINWSGFIEKISPEGERLIRQAIQLAKEKNVLIVVAAGNGLKNMDSDKETLSFPLNADFENVIYIANTNACGELVDYENNLAKKDKENRKGGSNYGDRAFIAAPAEFAITTMNVENGKGQYFLGGGTSNAAPMVSGVAALMLSVNPSLSFNKIKEILCTTSKKISSLRGKVHCGGIPDAFAALKASRDELKSGR